MSVEDDGKYERMKKRVKKENARKKNGRKQSTSLIVIAWKISEVRASTKRANQQ